MGNPLFVLGFLARILRGERFRRATLEQLRTWGAAMSLAGLIGMICLSLDSKAWTLPPALLWVYVTLFLFPVAIFFFWVAERVPPAWSLSVGVLIPAVVFAYAIWHPLESLPTSIPARAGLILDVVLMVVAGAVRRAR